MTVALKRPPVLPALKGYDLVAPYIDETKWSRFWQQNEAPLVIDWIRQQPTGRGLDAGSGTGPYLKAIQAAVHQGVAFDLSENMLRQNRYKNNGFIDYRQGSLEQALPFDNQSFDWILCTRVLSHLPDASRTISEFARVLRPGGECLITDVHPQHNYENTGFLIHPDDATFPEGYKVLIKTYKHPLDTLRQRVQATGQFDAPIVVEYGLMNLLQKPDPFAFRKLYDQPDRKIFYTLRLKKHQ